MMNRDDGERFSQRIGKPTPISQSDQTSTTNP
jgi:hypothetical protein